MKKLDKMKVNKIYDVLGSILAIVCVVAGIITQLKFQDTTQALCWIIAGILVCDIGVEVK